MKPNSKVLKAAAKLPIDFGPFVQSTTGAIVPFFNDSRAIYSHLDILKVFVTELTKIVKKYQKRGQKIDLIVGIPMAGIPIAMALSIKTRIPFAYLLKERKKTLRQRIVEGDYIKGSRALVIDDVIAFGGTILKAIKDCKSEGIIVKHVMTLWNPWHSRNKKFIQRLRARGITYDTLYNRIEWIEYLHAHGIVSKEMVEVQKAYLADPVDWHKEKAMWRKFLELKRKHKKTGKF